MLQYMMMWPVRRASDAAGLSWCGWDIQQFSRGKAAAASLQPEEKKKVFRSEERLRRTGGDNRAYAWQPQQT